MNGTLRGIDGSGGGMNAPFPLIELPPRNLPANAHSPHDPRRNRPRELCRKKALRTRAAADTRALAGLFQGFDQKEDFGRVSVIHIWGVGEGAVAAAGNDSLECADETAEAICLEAGSLLL